LPTPQGRTILDSSTVRPVQVLPRLRTPLETMQHQPKMPLVRQTQDWRARVPPMPHFPREEVPAPYSEMRQLRGRSSGLRQDLPGHHPTSGGAPDTRQNTTNTATTMAATELASPATSQYDKTMMDTIQPQHHNATDKDIPAPTPAENPWRTSRRRRRRG